MLNMTLLKTQNCKYDFVAMLTVGDSSEIEACDSFLLVVSQIIPFKGYAFVAVVDYNFICNSI